ncbi:N-acetylmuramoyl-L-alanine amidase [Candidatus Kirkpatrickella diaphorinae]|uniref:N-acetylmuramoyl-L-alanine amidase n=1 Tax=Candidatus Kirkpatrickella diaphorinae TaxID=2984322 RepID=A0ABY6GKN4_9PROT|nr:N-acetylmuramoyl-L-alanine amidase [Candidatus Kirkpatrickella diaphorinae]UYH51824.1 N-acetylmuramoyl-L-alanine amidase [Candidatus Kirkpatrickella diaphorinae]
MHEIIYNKYRSVSGFDNRQRFLVLHYTAGNFASSIAALTGPLVSVHYIVPDETDPSYRAAGYTDTKIFNLVDEKDRAWHAGVSYWRGRNNLNHSSIGIEIVNLATDDHGVFTFPPYPEKQIAAVKELVHSILQRYPDIDPRNVVAHSDIAPSRKSDPGPKFPWKELYDEGIGTWYDAADKQKFLDVLSASGLKMLRPSRCMILELLNRFGYDVSGASTSAGFTSLIRAVQLHYRPEKYDGVLDDETIAIILSLAEKYPDL